MNDYNEAVDKTLDELFKENPITEQEAEMASAPVDNYQISREARAGLKVAKNYGARPKLMNEVERVISHIAPAFRKAKAESEYWKEHGDTQRYQWITQQYMEDYFHPALEALVRLNSSDEVASSAKAAGELDKYVLIPGGKANGYTSSFVRSLYELSGASDMSDAAVQNAIRKIRGLVDQDQIRAAVGVATQIKNKIDAGENMANEEDYDLIQRVIIRSGK